MTRYILAIASFLSLFPRLAQAAGDIGQAAEPSFNWKIYGICAASLALVAYLVDAWKVWRDNGGQIKIGKKNDMNAVIVDSILWDKSRPVSDRMGEIVSLHAREGWQILGQAGNTLQMSKPKKFWWGKFFIAVFIINPVLMIFPPLLWAFDFFLIWAIIAFLMKDKEHRTFNFSV